MWKNPYLFNENVPGHEFQRNSKEIENIIKQSVEGTIRQLLPIKEILREHLDTYENDNSGTSKEDIKKLLKEELQELKNSIINSGKGNEDNSLEEDNIDNESSVSNGQEEDNALGSDNLDNPDNHDNSFKIIKEESEDLHGCPEIKMKELIINDLNSEEKEDIIIQPEKIEPANIYLSENGDDPTEEQIKSRKL